eukprot:scaffold1050_cov51-Cylindrotheca_fusiformis.AAC.2
MRCNSTPIEEDTLKNGECVQRGSKIYSSSRGYDKVLWMENIVFLVRMDQIQFLYHIVSMPSWDRELIVDFYTKSFEESYPLLDIDPKRNMPTTMYHMAFVHRYHQIVLSIVQAIPDPHHNNDHSPYPKM